MGTPTDLKRMVVKMKEFRGEANALTARLRDQFENGTGEASHTRVTAMGDCFNI